MYKNIFDSHAHYDDEQFDYDRNELLVSFKEKGVSGVVCCGVNIETSKFAVELSHKYDFVYSAVGFHPLDNDKYRNSDLEIIKELAKDEKCVAIGEIGLDYHYEKKVVQSNLYSLKNRFSWLMNWTYQSFFMIESLTKIHLIYSKSINQKVCFIVSRVVWKWQRKSSNLVCISVLVVQ